MSDAWADKARKETPLTVSGLKAVMTRTSEMLNPEYAQLFGEDKRFLQRFENAIAGIKRPGTEATFLESLQPTLFASLLGSDVDRVSGVIYDVAHSAGIDEHHAAQHLLTATLIKADLPETHEELERRLALVDIEHLFDEYLEGHFFSGDISDATEASINAAQRAHYKEGYFPRINEMIESMIDEINEVGRNQSGPQR